MDFFGAVGVQKHSRSRYKSRADITRLSALHPRSNGNAICITPVQSALILGWAGFAAYAPGLESWGGGEREACGPPSFYVNAPLFHCRNDSKTVKARRILHEDQFQLFGAGSPAGQQVQADGVIYVFEGHDTRHLAPWNRRGMGPIAAPGDSLRICRDESLGDWRGIRIIRRLLRDVRLGVESST